MTKGCASHKESSSCWGDRHERKEEWKRIIRHEVRAKRKRHELGRVGAEVRGPAQVERTVESRAEGSKASEWFRTRTWATGWPSWNPDVLLSCSETVGRFRTLHKPQFQSCKVERALLSTFSHSSNNLLLNVSGVDSDAGDTVTDVSSLLETLLSGSRSRQ